MHRILLVEDERNFALVMKDYLSMNGYVVSLASNGEEGARLFREEKYDLCLLDIMMPKKDGFTLAAEIREKDLEVPLLFLTARGMREDMLKGYRLGADDYVVKPFDSEVLLLKIKAILGRRNGANGNESQNHNIGSFSFSAKLRILKHEKGAVNRLSPKEASLLNLLCLHRNDVLPRERALKLIWKEDNYFTGRSMDVYIVKLRKYLSSDPSVEISSLHGNGYTLQVREL